jgi:hypothetical protein
LKKERAMIAHRKSLALAFISLATIALLGLRGDSPGAVRSEFAKQTATVTGGLLEVRYTYPAADISVALEDAFF